jgi:hypothetical protein
MKFKNITEEQLKHELDEALRNCLEREEIKINENKVIASYPLEHDYFKLLKSFEEHVKLVIKVNKGLKE